MKINKILAGLIVGGMAASVPTLHAEDGADNLEADFSLEALLNTGFRASLIKAIEAKRAAKGSQDTIVAEDIADFPDLNLAESIQRMPGVSITREGGEGRQISLRGVGPEFTQVQINGMEALAKTTSPMDSRGSLRRDRAFDFNIFASEMFSQINIYKSHAANLDEGGIGGTVGLYTAKPFDFDEQKMVVSGSLGTNSHTSDSSPRVNAFYTNNWGNFGVLASIFYSERDTAEKGVNTFRWRQRSTTNYADTIDDETAQKLEDGDLWFARGNRLSVWENTQERIGLNLAFQVEPMEDMTIGFTALYAELNNDRTEYHISTRGSSSTAVGRVEEIRTRLVDGHEEVVYGRFSDVTIGTETRVDIVDTTFEQYVLDGTWEFAPSWTAKAMIGIAESEVDQPRRDKVYYQTRDGQALTTDYSDRHNGDINFEFDTTDSSLWRFRDIDLRDEEFSDEIFTAKLDFAFEIDDISKVTFGVSHKTYENKGRSTRDENYISRRDTPQNNGELDVEDFYFVYREHDDANWGSVRDVDAVLNFFGLDGNLGYNNPPDKVEEDTSAIYVQYDIDTDIAGIPVRADVGLRYFSTDATYSGFLNGELTDLEHTYSKVLPSLNVAFEVIPDVIGRFSYSQNITRPYLADARPSMNLNTGDQRFSINGNPELEPFEADNFEISAEWYFSEAGFLAVGLFYKDISGFTDSVTSDVRYGDIGIPLDLLPDDQTADTIYTYSRLENAEEATIKGLEVTLQRDFDFLPAPFNRLGMVGNFTLARGEANYRNVQGTGEVVEKNFPGLSELGYNLTVYYEGDGWGARMAAAYRDEYIQFVEPGLRDEDERGFLETLNVDFTAYYQVNDNLKVSLEGINITDEEERQYSDSSQRLYNTTTAGRTFNLGVAYTFF